MAEAARTRVPKRVLLHTTLLALVVWSVTPFFWTLQTSWKFLRDVAAKEPVLWSYDTTANGYREFWLDDRDKEVNMWGILWFLLIAIAVIIAVWLLGRFAKNRETANRIGVGFMLLSLWVARQIASPDKEISVVAFAMFLAVLAVGFVVGRWLLGLLDRRWAVRQRMEDINWFTWCYGIAVFWTLWIAVRLFQNRFPVDDEFFYFKNSITVAALTVLISISLGLLAGYGLARYSGLSGAVILVVALAFRALPRTAFVLPYFFGAKRIDSWLEDSGIGEWDFPLIDFPFFDGQLIGSQLLLAIAMVAVNQPFTIWMLRSFFMEVPKEMEEAAMMDGATRFEAFRKVIVPMMWPGIVATSLFTLLLAYNEFLFARVLAGTEWTLPVAIVSITAGENSQSIPTAAAAAVSITIPMVIIIILFQKHLVKGLGAGAVKG